MNEIVKITFLIICASQVKFIFAENTERISRQKCRQYSQNAFDLSKISLFLNDTDSKDNISKCLKYGGPHISPYVNYREFPHMALILRQGNMGNRWLCSGVLISEQYILTTAACVIQGFTSRPNKVRLGTNLINFEDKKTYIDVIISEIIKHPEFKFPEIYNNIALLKSQHPVKFNEFIRPACLPDLNKEQKQNKQRKRYSLSGWNSLKDELEDFIIEKEDDKLCNNVYNYTILCPNGVDVNTQLCMKFYIDICDMFKGSALQTYDDEENCMYEIQGLLSIGSNCKRYNLTLYTKIAPYIDWIEKIVWLS